MQGWSCGLKTAQTSCVSGIPDGIEFSIGETVMDAVTCFCSGDLCNDQHFCDDCAVGSSGGKAVNMVLSTVIGLVLVFSASQNSVNM